MVGKCKVKSTCWIRPAKSGNIMHGLVVTDIYKRQRLDPGSHTLGPYSRQIPALRVLKTESTAIDRVFALSTNSTFRPTYADIACQRLPWKANWSKPFQWTSWVTTQWRQNCCNPPWMSMLHCMRTALIVPGVGISWWTATQSCGSMITSRCHFTQWVAHEIERGADAEKMPRA